MWDQCSEGRQDPDTKASSAIAVKLGRGAHMPLGDDRLCLYQSGIFESGDLKLLVSGLQLYRVPTAALCGVEILLPMELAVTFWLAQDSENEMLNHRRTSMTVKFLSSVSRPRPRPKSFFECGEESTQSKDFYATCCLKAAYLNRLTAVSSVAGSLVDEGKYIRLLDSSVRALRCINSILAPHACW